jgi:Ni/Fe-hydrogenase subunit HybB-like protein
MNNSMNRCYRIFGWNFTITPTRFVLLALAGLCGLVILLRLATGYQYVTNLSDETPWGLWIAFDVMTGVALAGGGYSTALLVSSFRYEKYRVVARGALLTSFLGYVLVTVGLFLDVGQWFNFWRPFVSWGYTSVLFEVCMCVSIYTTILSIEFYEVITERIIKKLHKYIVKILPVLIIIGLIFPMMHQSSLGGLFLISKSKMFPLWWSELLPIYFLLSSFFVGSAMVYIESALAKSAYGHEVSHDILKQLLRVGGRIMAVYLLLKVGDITYKGEWNLLFLNTLQSNMYLLEMVFGIIVPIIIIFSPLAKSRAGLMTYAWLTAIGVVLNRMNCVFTAMYTSGSYFPSIGEFAVSIGLVAVGCLVYGLTVENFNVIGGKHAVQVKVSQNNNIKEIC